MMRLGRRGLGQLAVLAVVGLAISTPQALAVPKLGLEISQQNFYGGSHGISLTEDPFLHSSETFEGGGGDNQYTIAIRNVAPGGSPTLIAENTIPAETQVTITDDLPPGIFVSKHQVGEHIEAGGATCKSVEQGFEKGSKVICTTTQPDELAPGEAYESPLVLHSLYVEAGTPSGEDNEVTVVGTAPGNVAIGGEPAHHETEIGEVPFEPACFSMALLSEAPIPHADCQAETALPELKAGGHPLAVETELLYKWVPGLSNLTPRAVTAGGGQDENASGPKEVEAELPPGMIGNVQNAAKCELKVFNSPSTCPSNTAVGYALVLTSGEAEIGQEFAAGQVHRSVIYNLAPPAGHPAAFGITVTIGELRYSVVLYAKVRSDGDYGVTVGSEATATLLGSQLVFCSYGVKTTAPQECEPPKAGDEPLLSNPTQCTEPLETKLLTTSWSEPAKLVEAKSTLPEPTECGAVPFEPTAKFKPTEPQPGQPSGMTFELNAKETNPECTKPEGGPLVCPPVSSALRNLRMELPEGVSVAAGAATGLVACQDSQFGLGTEFGTERHPLAGVSPVEPAREAECPLASQIGTLEVFTQNLECEGEVREVEKEGAMVPAKGAQKCENKPAPLVGKLYVAQPECSPCTGEDAESGRLLRLFLQLTDKRAGVIVKLEGITEVQKGTGRLVTEFTHQPQVPFERLVLHLRGGPRASLMNPETCSGEEESLAELTPWSSATPQSLKLGFSKKVGESEGFECPTSAPFTPSFTGGTTHPAAGHYSPFALSIERGAGDQQDLETLEVHMPSGLTAKIAGIPLCGEAAANAGTCSAASQVGTITVAIGTGPHPYYTQGQVYLTGPYGGGPFGLSIVTPTVAGPFVLQGNTGGAEEVIRSAILINEKTAAATVRSNPIPQTLDGLPIKVSRLNVQVNRPEFELNPSSCTLQREGLSATLTSSAGTARPVASSFDVGGCAALPFKPTFTASTQAKTSRTEGASLTVKVTQGAGEARIRKTDLQLPVELPSRLTTLQHACTEAQFLANPQGCPPQSFVGTATAHTPLLNVPLTGPAILVSHGGAEFPDLDFLLEGEGVKIDLVGHTEIRKGITFSRFEEIPDNPITSFETNLPEGPHSVLAANGNLCTENLTMPTTIVAQSGAEVTQQTKIAVTGCPATHKPKRLTRAQKLKKALAACRKKDKNHRRRRRACERKAHKRFGPIKKAKRKGRKAGIASLRGAALAGSGSGSLPVSSSGSPAVGLAGAATAVAASSEAIGACPNEASRAESPIDEHSDPKVPFAELLPECRAYEMVSPVEKQGFDILAREPNELHQGGTAGSLGFPVSPNGDAVGYFSEGLFAGTPAWQFSLAGQINPYLGRRGGSGWSSDSAYAPSNLIERGEPLGLFADTSSELGEQVNCGKAISTGYDCAERSGEGSWGNAGPFIGTEGGNAGEGRAQTYLGASSDLSRVFIQPSNYSLLPSDTLAGSGGSARRHGIYELTGFEGHPTLKLVNVVEEEDSEHHIVEHEVGVGAQEGAILGGATVGTPEGDYHAISEDGKAVFFTAQPVGGGQLNLYARLHGSETRVLSAPEECVKSEPEARCEEEAADAAIFTGASVDGSKVFFRSTQQLLREPTNGSYNLYEYDFDKPGSVKLTRLSRAEGGEGGEVDGVVHNSADGSHVYFVSESVLTTAPNTFNESAISGAANLYGVETEGGTVKFIGTLAHSAERSDSGLWITDLETSKSSLAEAQVTPDGRDLAFSTLAQLDDHDENGCQGAERRVEGGVATCATRASYIYDFATRRLIWISHVAGSEGDPQFAPHNEGDAATVAAVPDTTMGAWADIDDWNRAISGCGKETFEGCSHPGLHDGEDVIFTTSERLQAEDVNGAPDVYLWHCSEACEDPEEEATVTLISDGVSEKGVDLGQNGEYGAPAMSASGSDIFFLTHTSLVPQDSDELQDLYDARVDGGIAPAPSSPTCSGEECQGPIGSEPFFGSPGSAIFSAGENLIPPPVVSASAPRRTVSAKVARTHKRQAAKGRKARAKRRKAG